MSPYLIISVSLYISISVLLSYLSPIVHHLLCKRKTVICCVGVPEMTPIPVGVLR